MLLCGEQEPTSIRQSEVSYPKPEQTEVVSLPTL